MEFRTKPGGTREAENPAGCCRTSGSKTQLPERRESCFVKPLGNVFLQQYFNERQVPARCRKIEGIFRTEPRDRWSFPDYSTFIRPEIQRGKRRFGVAKRCPHVRSKPRW